MSTNVNLNVHNVARVEVERTAHPAMTTYRLAFVDATGFKVAEVVVFGPKEGVPFVFTE